MKDVIISIEPVGSKFAVNRRGVFTYVSREEAAQMKPGDEFESPDTGYTVLWIKINGKLVRNCATDDEVTQILRQ